MTVRVVVRVVWAGVLLVAPRTVLAVVSDPAAPDVRRARVVLRILGARHLVQAAFVTRLDGPVALRLATAVDAIHAVTAVGLALLDPRWRRAGLADAAAAATFAAADRRGVRRQHTQRSTG